MAKGSGMKKVDVVHCKPFNMGGRVGGARPMPTPMPGGVGRGVTMNNPKTAAPAPFKKGGIVVRGTGCAVKGKKFTGPNG